MQHYTLRPRQALNKAYLRQKTARNDMERFKRKEVTSEDYFSRLIFYIHFNPQHHGLLADFSEWPHSSYHTVLSTNKTALQRNEVLEWFGGSEAYKAFHQEIRKDFSSIATLLEEDDQ